MKGILFKEEMCRATIEGRKTQTRRIINPQPPKGYKHTGWLIESTNPKHKFGDLVFQHPDTPYAKYHRPKYKVGEIVYLKEPYIDDLSMDKIFYKFNTDDRKKIENTQLPYIPNPWKNKLFMPENAARYFIKITNVRVERVADISEEDAIAEGLIPDDLSPIDSFENLWQSINGKYRKEKDGIKRAYWFKGSHVKTEKIEIIPNPWVWVYEFKLTSK